MKNDQNDDASHCHTAPIQKLLVPPIVENTELKGQSGSRLPRREAVLCCHLEHEVPESTHQDSRIKRVHSTAKKQMHDWP